MISTISFKNIKSSEEISAYAIKKLSKVEKYKDFKLINARYIFSTEKEHSFHIAELILKIKNDTISASAKEKSMYQAIDTAVARVCKQLAKKKSSFKHRRHVAAKAS